MKKRIMGLAVATLATLTITGCKGGGGATKDLESLTITNKDALQADFYVGDSKTIALTSKPEINIKQAIQEGKLTVTSSANDVISTNGLAITALKAGESTISIKYNNYEYDTVKLSTKAVDAAKRYEKYCDASKNGTEATIQGKIIGIECYDNGTTITAGNIYLQEGKYGYRVNNVTLKQGEATLKVGDSVSITASGYTGSSKKDYKCLSGKGATVSILTTAIATDNIVLDKADFSVSEAAYVTTGDTYVEVTAIEEVIEYKDNDPTKAITGKHHDVTYSVNGKNYAVTYNGSFNSVAQTELYKAFSKVQVGSKIKAAGNLFADGKLSVLKIEDFAREEVKVSSIEITPFDFEVKYGFCSPMNVTVLPAIADKKEVDYEVSGPGKDYVQIIEDAIVVLDATAITEATTIQVVAKAKDGSQVESNPVTFNLGVGTAEAPTKINVTSPKEKITKGDEIQLDYEVVGNPGCANLVTWSSSNENVATVDENGLVTVKDNGNVTITATSAEYSSVTGSVDLVPDYIMDDSEPKYFGAEESETAPTIGGEYYAGLYQANLSPRKQLYATGVVSSYLLETTNESANAVKIKVLSEDEGETYKLQIVGGDNDGKFIDVQQVTISSKNYDKPVVVDDAASVTATITWDSDHNTFIFKTATTQKNYFLNSYNKNTTIGVSDTQYLESTTTYPLQLYANTDAQAIEEIEIQVAEEVENGIPVDVYLSTTPRNQAIPKTVEWSVEGTSGKPGAAEIAGEVYTRKAILTPTSMGEITITAKVGEVTTTKVISVAARTTVSNLTFPGVDQESVGGYTFTWHVKDTLNNEYTINNFNNNNNAWTSIKCGRKTNASVASIITPVCSGVTGYTSLSFTINAITATGVNSIKVYHTDDPTVATPVWTQVGNDVDKSKGTKSIDISSFTSGVFKIEFDCNNSVSGSNGYVEITNVSIKGTF